MIYVEKLKKLSPFVLQDPKVSPVYCIRHTPRAGNFVTTASNHLISEKPRTSPMSKTSTGEKCILFPKTNRNRKSALSIAQLAILCVVFLVTVGSASAAVTLTGATGGSAISADTTGGTWTTLTGPTLAEGANGDITAGTIILTAPTGFTFNTGAAVTVAVTGSGNAVKNINGTASGSTFPATVAASTISVTITNGSTGAVNTLTWQNIQVRPSAGTPLASGTIARSGTATLTGISGSWGTLTEVAGNVSKLVYVQQPTAAQTGQTISPAVTVKVADQFSNTITTSSATVNLAIGTNPGSGTLSGTASVAASSGVATFNDLSINNVGTGYTLTASSTGLTSATSSAFNITKGATTMAVGSSGSPSLSGQSVTFTATVSVVSPATGTLTGSVTFKDGATTLGTGTLSAGQATFSTSSLSVASHSITAEYAGSSNFTGSTNSPALTQTVDKASTTMALSSSVNPSVSGESVTFTAVLSVTSPGSGTPTGTVAFKDGATTLGTGTLSSGQATFATSSLNVASHSITAEYAGSSNFIGSTNSPALSQTVNKADATTTIASSANPSLVGQSVTFTATVAATSPGTGTPSGTVTFKDGSTTLGTGTLSSGQATFSTSALSLGSHSVTAVYGGDSKFNTSSSSTLSQTVNTANTTTSVSSSANPAVSGQSVTFTATVAVTSPGSGTATGTVTFKDGSTTLGTGTLSGGQATFATAALSVGLHSITVVYGGDSNYNTSTSSALSQTVNKASTTMAVASGTNPSVSGQSVTYTATVTVTSPGSGTASGSVTFKDGITVLGTKTLAGNVATLSNSSLSVGSHSITAEFAGDSNLNGSTNSPALSQTVNKADTTTSVAASANPSVNGQSVTFTATVATTSPGSGTASGTVTFKDGSTTLGTASLSSGQATFSTSALSVGSHSITAVYGGDSSFNTSTSSTLSQTVNKASTTVSASSSPNPSVTGQSVTLSATVSVTSPGSGTPTGTVTFKSVGNVLCSYTLTGSDAGVASCSVPLDAGSYSITAEYAGDSNYNAATSSASSQTVNKAGTTTTASTTPASPVVYGTSVTLSADVAPVSPGTGTPTGSVEFFDGATSLGTATLSSGHASTTTTFAIGDHTIGATYIPGSDVNYQSSSSTSASLTVNKSAPTISPITSSPSSPILHQSVLFTATIQTASGTGTVAPTGTVQFKFDGSNFGNPVTLSGANASSDSISTLSQGDHTVAVEYSGDSNYKAGTNSVTVTISAPLANCSASNSGAACAGGTVQLFGTTTDTGSDVYYSWTGPNGFTSTEQNPTISNVTSDNAGTYWLTTGTTGTTNCIESTVVTVAPALTASVSAETVCAGTSGNLTANVSGGTAPYSYVWSPGGATTQTISVTDGGTYMVTVSDSTGSSHCSVQASGALIIKSLPTVAIDGANTVCPKSTNIYSAPAGMSAYAWSVSGAASIDGAANTQTVSVIAEAGCNTNFSVTLNVVANGCANSTSTNVAVVDTTAPTITSVPADATVGCASAVPSANDAAVEASDDCSTVTVTHLSDSVTASNCPNNFTITRTYVATDACGNSSSQVQTITVHDTTGPVITGFPADATYTCSSAVPSADDNAVTATDACGGSLTVTHSDDVVTPGSCVDRYTIARTYIATDACGNSSSQTQNITVNDNVAPVLAGVPADVTAQCNNVPTAATPTATDNCDSNPTVSFNESSAAGSCPGSYVITRVWTATDSCGNSSSASQTVTVVDTTAPVLAGVPADVTAQCDDVPTAANPTALDNCDSNPNITFAETSAAGSCAGSFVLTRTWTATDACGNSSSATQHVTVIDTTAPVIAGVPADATVQCDAVPTAATATATDACDSAPTITFHETSAAGTCANSSVLTRTWTATDACGNSSSKTQTITVIDTTAPVIAGVPADATVQCDAVPTAATPTVTDNCDTNATLSFNETSAAGSCANAYVLTRTWTATDACGNSSTKTQTITVIDTTAPVLAGVPNDTTVQCNEVPTAATPTATDTCDTNPSITFNESTTPGACAGSYTLTRVWTATDACGNSSSGTQVITVIDTTAPVLAGVPADVTAQCNAVPTAATPTATDNCDSNPNIAFAETSAAGSCAGSYVLTRTWTATDACGNSSSLSQHITVIDTTAPVLAGVPSDATVQCDAVPTAATATATDNCDSAPTVSFAETSAAGTCSNSYVLTRTWTATDACGNSSSATQTITVIDTTAPVLAGVPADATVQCNEVPTAASPTATDTCDSAPKITFNETSAAGSCANAYVLTRTWTATDACGNSSSKTQSITVIDTTAPVIAGVPADVTAQCNNVPTAATPTATDNCDGAPTISFNETTTPGSCAGKYVLTRVWTATDVCGNSSSATQVVTVIDTTAPVLAGVPSDVTTQCNNIPTAATPTATDNCDSNPTISFDESTVSGSVAGQFTIVRTWTATDACGNTSSATQHITAFDSVAPVLSGVPADATAECSAVPTAATPTASDACDAHPNVSFAETTTAGSCSNSYGLTRTWTATDASGNSSSATQTITVHDTTAPTLTGVPADTTVQCDAVPTAATLTATDNCDSTPTVSMTESRTNGACASSYTLTRVWTATDSCGNSSSATQVITVIDTTAPVIAGVPADATVQCDNVPTAATPTVSDNCDSNPNLSFNQTTAAGACAGSSVITRVWASTDACGNTSSKTQTITVIDTTAPVLSGVPADVTAQCSAVPTAATPSATDNCDSNPHIAFNESSAAGACAGSYVLTRTWTATDACGNSSSGTQHITVIDTIAPVLAGVPANTTVQCDSIPTAGTPTATDNCDSDPHIAFSESTIAGSCAGSYTLKRTWTASDVCGNSSSATQLITVIDTTAPVLAGVPANTTAQCGNVPTTATPTASDNCDSNPHITFGETTTAGACAGNYTVTRTWTATDACGNSSSKTQVITVSDTTAPTLAGIPADTTAQCGNVPSAATPTASDNCDSNAHITFSESSTPGACANSYVLTRTWTATDACGNSSSATQTITVSDTTAPVLAGVPSNTTVQCDDIPTVATPTATDNCDSNPNVSFDQTTTAGSSANNYTITRTWTATDSCGNTTSGQQVITVVDTSAPVLAGVPANTTVTCDAIPTVASPTATDNCDAHATVSLSETSTQTASGCSHGNYSITRTWTASDAAGNSSSGTQVITVTSVPPVITGFPIDATYNCANLVPAANDSLVTATDACGGTPTITHDDDVVSSQTCANRYTITRTYHVTSACGDVVSKSQTIVVYDTTGPVITGFPADATYTAVNQVPSADDNSVTATDNCGGGVTVTHSDDQTVAGSDAHHFTITRTYTATDACGNATTQTQTFTLNTVAAVSVTITGSTDVKTNKATWTFKGTASGENAIANVLYKLNGGAPQPASGTANWTAALALIPGSNTFEVYAVDTDNNQSAILTAQAFYSTSNKVVVIVQDWPHTGNKSTATFLPAGIVNNAKKKLEIGKSYTITAVPGANRRFLGWSHSTDTNVPAFSTDAQLTFVFDPTQTLVARFEDPFYYIKGAYTGLFAESTVQPRSAGYITFNVPAGSDASANKITGGKIYLNGTKYLFAPAKFDSAGHAHITTTSGGFTIDLVADLSGGFNGAITGTVGDGTWVADATAYRNILVKPADKASFTMAIPATEGTPNGYGIGALKRNGSGSIAAAGTLADGTAWTSVAGKPAVGGQWPLFAQLYKKNANGMLWGWLQFTDDHTGPTGNVYWFRPSGINSLNGGGKVIGYDAGFTSANVEIVGSAYTNTPPALNWTGNGMAFLFDGINKGATNIVNVSGQTINVVTDVNYPTTDKLAVHVVPATGLINGAFLQPQDKKTQKSTIKGVLLQGQAAAVGVFYRTNAGQFLMEQPTP
jgi:large repetitive protein